MSHENDPALPHPKNSVVSAGTSAEELARIAGERPDLWETIWNHPNCYDGLRAWIAEQLAAREGLQQVVGASAAGVGFDALLNAEPGATAGPGTPAPWQSEAAVPPAASGVSAGAHPKKRKGALVASVVAAALVLGGGTAALAFTQTWPFGAGGPLGFDTGGSATSTASAKAASFADGAAELWSYTGPAGESTQALVGHKPRMVEGYTRRDDQPVQIEGAVVFHGGVGAGNKMFVEVVDSATGEVIWSDIDTGRKRCMALPDPKTAACVFSEGEGATSSEVVVLNAEGEKERFSLDGDLGLPSVIGDDLLFAAGDTLLRVTTSGKQVWRSERLNLDRPRNVEVAGELVFTRGASAWALVGRDGRIMHRQDELGGAGGYGNSCDYLLTERKLLMVGAKCDPSVQTSAITAEMLDSSADPLSIRYLPGVDGAWLVNSSSGLSAYDLVTGEERWTVQGQVPGWFQEPQRIVRAEGDGLLITGTAQSAGIVDLRSGKVQELGGLKENAELALARDAIVAGTRENGALRFINTASGDLMYEVSHDGLDEILGGSEGLLIAQPTCVNCTTAEGSHGISGYTFFGPSSGGSSWGSSGSGVVPAGDLARVAEGAPGFVPACPAGTYLLAWMELADGWIVVCGYDVDEPAYVAYKPAGSKQTLYSNGWNDLSGSAAQGAVTWDEALQRYQVNMEDGSRVVLDYSIGAVVQRAGSGSSAVQQQERGVRWVFVPMGTGVRSVSDASGSAGAFSVQAPKETAEDQVRYMIEVLEKAYAGRAMLKDALPKLQHCQAAAGGYGDTVSAMKAVRDNRAELLTALDAMPVDKIPDGKALLADLTEAITFSHRANVEYVSWAEAANARGCAQLSGAGQVAVDASDAPKERFASRWNSRVAGKFGVRTFDGWYI